MDPGRQGAGGEAGPVVRDVVRSAFKHRHLLAETRRHLAFFLRGRAYQPCLDEQIVPAVVDDCTRPASRRNTTATVPTVPA
ncbi:hypothetical protein ACFVGY_19755 [Streptomyces sp. NPDC127106]|uniref:hypothetical protein n=1 Tax=Streptomyces sp. NPDC127106 TaxID=3345360 RepID=UPI00363B33E0